MSDVKSSNEVKKTTPVAVAPQISAPPSVTLIGCGGCGINTLRSVLNELPADSRADHIRRFDTSYSNIRSGESMVQVATGDGSGKVRSENAQAIQKKMASLSDEELGLSDINIILFSLAGGSGSVIAPTLVREVERRGGKAVVVVVADTMSERDTDNTLKTLQTLQAICVNNNIYLPAMVFSNTGVGRRVVDITIAHRVGQLLGLLIWNAIEIDRNDRRNFFNGMKTVGARPGIRLVHVVGAGDGDDGRDTGEVWEYAQDDIYDATLSIGVETTKAGGGPSFVERGISARVAYVGVFSEKLLTPLMGMITSGDQGVSDLMRDLDATLAKFNAQSRNIESAISFDTSKVGDGDLIL